MKRRIGKSLLTIALMLAMLLGSTNYAYAKSTQQQLDEAQKEQEKTQQEKDQAEDQKKNLIGEQTTLQGTLDALNKELTKVSENLAVIEGDISAKEAEIAIARAELEAAKQVRDEQNFSMQKRIQFMYESSTTTYWDMLFSAKSFSELINGATYINSITTYDRNMLEAYKQTVALIEEKETQLNLDMAELARLKVAAVQEQNKVMDLVAQTSKEIAKYADEIEELEDSIEAYEKELAERDADKAEENQLGNYRQEVGIS